MYMMARGYRVWTNDISGNITCHTDWLTRGECKKYMHGRWGYNTHACCISSAQYSKTVGRIHFGCKLRSKE